MPPIIWGSNAGDLNKYKIFIVSDFPSPSDRPYSDRPYSDRTSDRPSDDETFSPVNPWVIVGSLAVVIFFAFLFGKYVLPRLYKWYRSHAEREITAREDEQRHDEQITPLNTSENAVEHNDHSGRAISNRPANADLYLRAEDGILTALNDANNGMQRVTVV